ncbi:hypothetical protein Pan258_22710 [Symmachiella dynata]|nr:hypothetical protein Pan258_22710 [Symmachiella dynata]
MTWTVGAELLYRRIQRCAGTSGAVLPFADHQHNLSIHEPIDGCPR